MQTAKEIAKLVCLASAAVLLLVTSWQVWNGPKLLASYADRKLAPLEKSVVETSEQVKKLLATANTTAEDNYKNAYTITKSTAALIYHSDQFVSDLRANINGGRDTQGVTKAGLLADFHGALVSMKATMDTSGKELAGVLANANTQLNQLGPAIQKVGDLAQTLDKQVQELSPKAEETLTALNAAIADADKLLADPAVQSTLKNVDKMSYHLGESAQSVDIALQDLRKKMYWWKIALKSAWSAVKFTLPIL